MKCVVSSDERALWGQNNEFYALGCYAILQVMPSYVCNFMLPSNLKYQAKGYLTYWGPIMHVRCMCSFPYFRFVVSMNEVVTLL